MTTIQFLAEWALRSTVLILSGASLLRVLRVKDASIRLAAWTAMLAGSLLIPVLTAALPNVPVAVTRLEAPAPGIIHDARPVEIAVARPAIAKRFDWERGAVVTAVVIVIAIAVYVVVAFALLLRLLVGLAMSRRLLRGSRAIDRTTEGIEIRESDRVAAPVTLGILRPAIVLPCDWRDWNAAKLDAVLAHERSHIRRWDPAVQLVSAIHRALLWQSPLSWFLHRQIVRVAEDASDDAAVAFTRDRALYAEVLLEFMQRGVRGMNWLGVPMARYGRAEARIHRILDGPIPDGKSLSRGVTRWSVAAIVGLVSPLAYIVATAHASLAAPQASVKAAPAKPQGRSSASPANPAPGYLTGLGNVVAMTVTVASRVDGELMSVGFDEGKPVQTGQLLASINPHNAQAQLDRAERELEADQARATGRVDADQRDIDSLKLELAYAQVRAPFAGTAGLRKIDPGNYVHAGETLVVITQLQPIAVVFTIPEDALPRVLARLRGGPSLPVEAWNRDMTVRLASGHLTAVDNLIDDTTGMAKIKATFDNKDGALFPNQFVNVRVAIDTR